MLLWSLRLPRYKPSGLRRVRLLNTVAGPCRIHTGFPVSPSRTPRNLKLIYQTRFVRLWLHLKKRAAATPQAPESAVPSKIRDRQGRNIDAPERLCGSLQRDNDSRANHCGMRDSESVTGAALTGQPTLNALKQASDGFAAMRSRIHIGEPSMHSFWIGRLNLFQRFATPRMAVQILQFLAARGLEPQSFGSLCRPPFRSCINLTHSWPHPPDRPEFFKLTRLNRFIERKSGLPHSRGRRMTEKRDPSRYIGVFQPVTSREPTIVR